MRYFSLLMCSLLTTGCAVGPDYKEHAANVPATFRGQDKADSATLGDLPWFELFKDKTLQGLLTEAQKNNYDIRIAAQRVEQSRALSAQARAQLYPSVGYNGGVSRGRNEFLGSAAPNGGQTTDAALAALNVAWEIDIWGKIRRSNEAARARYLASTEARNGVMISLISGVAQSYFELLELDLEKQIAQSTTASFAKSLKLFQDRLKVGTASKLDIMRAEAAQASTSARIPELERQIVNKENQINVLLGRNPGPVERNSALLSQTMPLQVPVGMPSTLLRRRPDIRGAEANMKAANAEIGVAVAQFFPQIGLTTLMGRVSPELSAFSGGAGNAWSVAATVAGPLFSGGALKAQYEGAKASFKEAELTYEQTVLGALQEVSNTLVTRTKLEDIGSEQERAVRAYKEAVRLSMVRYETGKANYFEVLDAQQQLFPAENALAQTQLGQLTVVVQLYKALGGGWTDASSPAITAQATPANTNKPLP